LKGEYIWKHKELVYADFNLTALFATSGLIEPPKDGTRPLKRLGG
jgi:hypothetical protein